MNDAVLTIRRQIRALMEGQPGTGVRYPGAVREAAIRLAHERHRAGHAVCDTARELGLRPATLYLWLRRKPGKRLRPVAIIEGVAPSAAALPSRPVLITPHGYRLEGFSCAEVVELLRRLS